MTLGVVDYCARCAPIWHPSFGPGASPAALASAAVHYVGARWPADHGRIPPGHVARLAARWSFGDWQAVAATAGIEDPQLDDVRDAIDLLAVLTPRAVLELVR